MGGEGVNRERRLIEKLNSQMGNLLDRGEGGGLKGTTTLKAS